MIAKQVDKKTQVVVWDPGDDPNEGIMEFRLTYQGELFASGRRGGGAIHTQRIRKVFHRQLKNLWWMTPTLRDYYRDAAGPQPHMIEALAERFAMKSGYRFVPLVATYENIPDRPITVCSLDVLFLRPEGSTDVIRSGEA